jgi:hypothetical protein
VKLKAAVHQILHRTTITPIARKEATGFATGGCSNRGAGFKHNWIEPFARQEECTCCTYNASSNDEATPMFRLGHVQMRQRCI